MKKEYRLLKNQDFKKVLDNKKSVANKDFVIYKRNNELDHVRVGVSVSSKIGNSVVRHKIKRQINEFLSSFVDVSKNMDFVIIVRNHYLSNDFLKNKEEFKKLFFKF